MSKRVHVVHPICSFAPLTLLSLAVGADLLHLVFGVGAAVAAHLIAAGLLVGITAAGLCWLTWLEAGLDAGRPDRTAVLHEIVAAGVLVLFGVSWLLRLNAVEWEPSWPALVLAFVGAAGGWLGSALVERRRADEEPASELRLPSHVRPVQGHAGGGMPPFG